MSPHSPGEVRGFTKDIGGLPGYKTIQKRSLAQLKMTAQWRYMVTFTSSKTAYPKYYYVTLTLQGQYHNICPLSILLYANSFVKHLSNEMKWSVEKKPHRCHPCCAWCCISSFITFGLMRRSEASIILQWSYSRVRWLFFFLKWLSFELMFSSCVLVIVPTN